jgi:meso-butanediol dehydrogenase/(S,S)-butanediol dehydrogenase/diacetyl reductase
MRLDNKVAIVTGGASGIGKGIVERFVEAGAKVAVLDIDGNGADALAGSLGLGRTLPLHGDISSDAQVRSAIDAVVKQWHTIDILINNAGIEVHGTVEEITPDQWERQLDVNLKGAYLLSRYAIPHMRRHGGSIVNISSVHAMVSWPRTVAYDVSKCGLIGLTRTMALDHGRDGIRVNAVCPGYIHTSITDRWLETVPDREAALRQVLSLHPLGRIGTPRDVAEACLFLVSDGAAFINGTYLVVDGGMTAAGH